MNNNYKLKGNMNPSAAIKTDCRGFVNAILDLATDLARKVRLGNAELDENCLENYTLSYLLTLHNEQEGVKITNIKYYKTWKFGICCNSVSSFCYRLDLDDCDIELVVSSKGAKLYIGGVYATSLHCPNGAYAFIMSELYSIASALGVAA